MGGIYYIGIKTQNANLSSSNWAFSANGSRGGTYIPPNQYDDDNDGTIEEEKEMEEIHYEPLNDKNKKNMILDLNTMNAMKKDLKNDELEAKFSPRGVAEVRRRAFTAGTGIAELISHPMAYQSHMIEGPGFYVMGIIDILQEYNWEKKIERFFKVFVQCIDGYGISCIEPTLYRKRFLAKMLQIGIGRTGDTEQ